MRPDDRDVSYKAFSENIQRFAAAANLLLEPGRAGKY